MTLSKLKTSDVTLRKTWTFEEILLDISASTFNFNVLKHNCGRNEMEH